MRRSEKLLSYQVIFMENGPRRTGARGFPLFCLCKQIENTRQCVKNEKILYERKKLGNPCTENSENSTKLGGKNERTTKNKN